MADMNTNILPDRDAILGLIEVVRKEIAGRKKKLSVADEDLAQKVMDRIAVENKAFCTERERRTYYSSVVREVVWQCANCEEVDEIISRLKSDDHEYVCKFFYKDCSRISGLRSRIIGEIRRTYKVEVSKEEFGNILYEHLWDNGTWGVLDSYSGKGSFSEWL